MIFLRVLPKKIYVAPLLEGPRSSGAHWTAWTPGSYATEVTYRAISDYFLKLNVFSHWRLEAHIPLYCHGATPNIGGDIPIDVPTNQNISGDTSPLPGIHGGVDA